MMKNKICMCFIIFAIVMMNISCNNEMESNPISSEKSLNDDVENNSEGDMEEDSGDDFDYTDEGFIKRKSIYRNPIDQYFWPKLNSWDVSEVEYRQAQRDYHKAWKAEFKNLMKFMKKKCVYDEDKKNLKLLEKSVADQVDIEKEVLKTELIDAYEVNPDSSKVKNSVSRMSLPGNGTRDRLTQIEGELYRDVCMRIIGIVGDEEYDFKFHETDYMNQEND